MSGGWIPCRDRLPGPQAWGDKDFSDTVLVSLHIGDGWDVICVAYYCFSRKRWYTEGTFAAGEVTAWMAVEPYRECLTKNK